jgi:hypothetical protein
MNERRDIRKLPDLPQILFGILSRNFQKNDLTERPSIIGKAIEVGFSRFTTESIRLVHMMAETSSTALKSNPGELERYGQVTATVR